ncbi:MAG: FAD-binding oxidoreductase [Candidatus Babeliales bacterium]
MKKIVLTSLFMTFYLVMTAVEVTDISKLDLERVEAIYTPESIAQLQIKLTTLKKPISAAGARCSQGLHIAAHNGTMIDLVKLNHIVNFNKNKKQITIEAGAIWRNIQEYIDRYNLSLAAIQSYNDFSVGGSLSVNVHGRDIHYGSLITMVESIDLLIASGDIVHASRTENLDAFYGAIGGYGALGIIVRATINLVDNSVLECKVEQVSLDYYQEYFLNFIKNNQFIHLHNANIFPPDLNRVAATSWQKTDKPLTNKDRLHKQTKLHRFSYMVGEQLVRRSKLAKKIRKKIEWKNFNTPCVVWRNYEMSKSISQHEPLTRFPTTTILQEYFIPIEQYHTFTKQFKAIIKKHNINMLNISIRHVPADKETVLAYAPQESFAFVCYINVFNTKKRAKK